MNNMDGWPYSPPPQTQRSINGGKMENERVCDAVKGMSDKEIKGNEQTTCSVLCRKIHKYKASLLLLFTNFVSRSTMLYGKAWHFYAKRVKLIVQIFVRKQRMRMLIRHRGPRSMLTHHYVGNTKIFKSNCQATEPEWDRTSSSIFPRTGSANTN